MTQLTQFPRYSQRDDFTLMMVPCRLSKDENLRYHLYYCPTDRSHRQKARYLGLYWDKSIRGIGEIRKRVECSVDLEAGRVIGDDGDDLEQDEKRRILGAAQEARKHRPNRRFYLCDEIVLTDFKKTSAGGIRGHRDYDLGRLFGDDALSKMTVTEIANRLREESWYLPSS